MRLNIIDHAHTNYPHTFKRHPLNTGATQPHSAIRGRDKQYMNKVYNTASPGKKTNYLGDFPLACSLAARINLKCQKSRSGRGTVKEIVGNRFFGGMGLEGEFQLLVVFQDRLLNTV